MTPIPKTHVKKKNYRRVIQTLQKKGLVNDATGRWGPGQTGLTSHQCMMAGSTHGRGQGK